MNKISSQPLPDYLKEKCINPVNRSDQCRKVLEDLQPGIVDTYEFENETECSRFKSTLMGIARERLGRRRVCTSRRGKRLMVYFNPAAPVEGGC